METLSPFAFVTLVTLISGAGGTGLGGLIGALFKSESNRTISLLLAFAGGVMTAMVCFDWSSSPWRWAWPWCTC